MTKPKFTIIVAINILISAILGYLLFESESVLAEPVIQKKVVLVEYCDYECPHCRNMATVINQLRTVYPDLRIVYKPTPILNENSFPVASLILASEQYTDKLHDVIISSPSSPTVMDVLNTSQQLGINQSKLIQMAKQDSIKKQLQQNIQLAEFYSSNDEIELPIFVIGKSNEVQEKFVLKGEQPYQLLSAIIQQLEQNNDSKNSNISWHNSR